MALMLLKWPQDEAVRTTPVSGGVPRCMPASHHHLPSGSRVRLEDSDDQLAIPCFDR